MDSDQGGQQPDSLPPAPAGQTGYRPPLALQLAQRVGAGAAAGLVGGAWAGLQTLVARRGEAPTTTLALQLVGLGALAGLCLGLLSLTMPISGSPAAMIGRWLRRGAAGVGDRAVALLLALLLALHAMWSFGTLVDRTFHHRLLSAALLTLAALGLVPLGLAAVRTGERVSGKVPELLLLCLLAVALGLGLRLSGGPSPGALQGPLVLSSGVLAVATAWTLVRGATTPCLLALVVAPLTAALLLLPNGEGAGLPAGTPQTLCELLSLWFSAALGTGLPDAG